MPDWLAVVLLGIVEGLTEFLPVSSTGHLLIAERWLNPEIARTDFFKIIIQCGALLAVLVVFSKRATDLVLGWRSPECRDYLLKLAAAFIITGIGGLFVKKVLHLELPKTLVPVAIATLLGGVIILWVESALKKRKAEPVDMTWTAAVAVGLAQLLAGVFPGTSRSGACILIAIAVGIRRPVATEFSFLVGIPTMFAATALELHQLLKTGVVFTGSEVQLILLGCVTSAISAFLVVRWLLRYVLTHDFVAFGYYRIALGIALFILLTRPTGP